MTADITPLRPREPLSESATDAVRRSIADAHSARRTLEDGIAAQMFDLVASLLDAASLENMPEGRRCIYQGLAGSLDFTGASIAMLRTKVP